MITDKVGGSSAKPEVSKQSKEKRLKHKVSGYKSESKQRSIAGCRLLLRTLMKFDVWFNPSPQPSFSSSLLSTNIFGVRLICYQSRQQQKPFKRMLATNFKKVAQEILIAFSKALLGSNSDKRHGLDYW